MIMRSRKSNWQRGLSPEEIRARKRRRFLAAATISLPFIAPIGVEAATVSGTPTSSNSFPEGSFVDISVDISNGGNFITASNWTLEAFLDGNSIASTNGSGSNSPAELNDVQFAQDGTGSWSISGSIDYEGGQTESLDGSESFTINNVAPTIESATLDDGNGPVDGDITVTEKTMSVNAAVTSTDPGADSHSYTIGGQDGGTDSSISGTRSSQNFVNVHPYQDGEYNILFEVSDDDTTTSTKHKLTVTNSPAEFTDVIANSSSIGLFSSIAANEGEVVTVSAEAFEFGIDPYAFTIDGNAAGGNATPSFGSRSSIQVGVSRDDEGSYSIPFSITDDDVTATINISFEVSNVAPEIITDSKDKGETTGNSVLDYSQSTTFPFESMVSDPGINDVISYAWDLDGDGQFDDSTDPNPSFDYSTLPSLFSGQLLNLGLQVNDGDGGSDEHLFTLTIQNVPVPEPAGFTLAGLAAASFGWFRRHFKTFSPFPLRGALPKN